ncbi:hypothetical protein BO71DRAFT_395376 [Aspergillus ellipticus CBS 707.79]|uniref:Uncharacterized protein n=1 Tax=Aspergillus ellipticus CBS 707.79 TaxID=1448320 RepID=A0A319EBX6_9EURO|nr:hypothetical protein BO71DRAFT_395376 [Aspergillus ellipticus CBS 707.79]
MKFSTVAPLCLAGCALALPTRTEEKRQGSLEELKNLIPSGLSIPTGLASLSLPTNLADLLNKREESEGFAIPSGLSLPSGLSIPSGLIPSDLPKPTGSSGGGLSELSDLTDALPSGLPKLSDLFGRQLGSESTGSGSAESPSSSGGLSSLAGSSGGESGATPSLGGSAPSASGGLGGLSSLLGQGSSKSGSLTSSSNPLAEFNDFIKSMASNAPQSSGGADSDLFKQLPEFLKSIFDKNGSSGSASSPEPSTPTPSSGGAGFFPGSPNIAAPSGSAAPTGSAVPLAGASAKQFQG